MHKHSEQTQHKRTYFFTNKQNSKEIKQTDKQTHSMTRPHETNTYTHIF